MNEKLWFLGDPKYPALNYLHVYNSISAIDTELKYYDEVMNGRIEFWEWGADFCVVTSYKDISIVEHQTNPETGEHEWDKIYKYEIPTEWLMLMLKETRKFLVNGPNND